MAWGLLIRRINEYLSFVLTTGDYGSFSYFVAALIGTVAMHDKYDLINSRQIPWN